MPGLAVIILRAAAQMVVGVADGPVEQHLRVAGDVESIRVLGGHQRLPSLLRQVAVPGLAAAVRGVRAGQLVDLLVAGVAGVSLDPHELDRTGALGQFGIDGLDERGVLDRLLLAVLPAVPLPAVHPLGRAVDRVLRIGFDDQWLAARVRAQRLQHGAQLADLVGAVRGAARVAVAGVLMPGLAAGVRRMVGPCPAHRPIGIAERRTVRGNRNRHASHPKARCGATS